MKQEKSAGFIVFKDNKYLILEANGRLDTPKGNVEKGEKELEAAKRELFEETGIENIRVIFGFREEEKYFYKDKEGNLVSKTVVYFLGEAPSFDVKLSNEHSKYSWLNIEGALDAIKYKGLKEVLRKAVKSVEERKL